MNYIFSIFPILFSLVFLLVFGTVIYTIVRSIKREHRNNRSPRLTVEAKVVGKRTDLHRGSGSNNHVGHGYTAYFVTFEVQSGDRMELSVTGQEFGLLVEGDYGDLSFQGTRFLNFARKIPTE